MKTNMLLIIVLGLFAKSALVSGDCDYVTPTVENFDWYKFSGTRPWYYILHLRNDFEGNLACDTTIYSSPERNTSLLTTNAYDISEKRLITTYGYATNWNSTGYFEQNHLVPMWNARVHVLAVDYDRYVIVRYCTFASNKMYIYVAFRSPKPDEATIKDVLKDLKNNNIDGSLLLQMRADHCQQVQSPEGGRNSA